MIVHCQDWGGHDLGKLDKGAEIYKFHATKVNPQVVMGQGALAVREVHQGPFRPHEIFEFPGIGRLGGNSLESELRLRGLPPLAETTIRTLFRFAHMLWSEQWRAAETKVVPTHHFEHPFDALHGINDVGSPTYPTGAEIHLDVVSADGRAAMKKLGFDPGRWGSMMDIEDGSYFVQNHGTAGSNVGVGFGQPPILLPQPWDPLPPPRVS